jgi:hypothetical protein
MTFKTDIQEDIADIIDDVEEFGDSAIHTPQGGAAQTAIGCLIGESILHGDDKEGIVNQESVFITVKSSDVTTVKIRDSISINSVDYTVVNDPYTDSETTAVSVIQLRRTIQTKI